MNFERSTSVQTLPFRTKKKSLPKRSITFADLPPSLKKSSDSIIYSSHVKPTSKIEQSIQPLQETSTCLPQVISYQTPARFQLPPTPLTAPDYWENLDTSASFSKRQIARSVDGNFQVKVKVGFKSMFNILIVCMCACARGCADV